ncbi:MAG: hypothetical protein KC731_09520 [Myxococcales bacterium]|nr:hypothetical protein [Myxococcales bacterium]
MDSRHPLTAIAAVMAAACGATPPVPPAPGTPPVEPAPAAPARPDCPEPDVTPTPVTSDGAWGNPSVTSCAVKHVALELRQRGGEPGLAPFRQRVISEKWVPHGELLAVVAGMTGLAPMIVPHGEAGGEALLLVEGLPAPAEITPSLARETILRAMRTFLLPGDPAEAIDAFLRSHGYRTARPSPLELHAETASGALEVVWPTSTRHMPTVTLR